MKRVFAFAAVCALLLTACQPDPVLTIDKDSITFDVEGGTQVVRVTSNYAWTAQVTGGDITVTPTGAAESADVAITVGENTTSAFKKWSVVFVCANKDLSMTKTLSIDQGCPKAKVEVSYEFDPPQVNRKLAAEGCTITMTVVSNAPWQMVFDAEDVVLDKTSGPAGTSTVKAVVPPCPVFEGRAINFEVSCQTEAGPAGFTAGFGQLGGIIVYGGETYHAVEMKDGNWWMMENLRYIPQGMTPSSDANNVSAGIWYPLVIDVLNDEKATVKFSTDADVIKANGYLYNTEVALGLQPGDITVENAGNYEGVQGICPSGWHIPTKADILGLVGKTADKDDTNPNAPYFDPDLNGGNGSVALLNADGWNAGAWGAVSIANTAAAKGTMMGAIKAYQEGMNTGYIAGSSLRQVTQNDDGTLKNVQYVAFMPNMNQGTFNGAWNNYRNGVSVRCVKNK